MAKVLPRNVLPVYRICHWTCNGSANPDKLAKTNTAYTGKTLRQTRKENTT